MTHDQQKRADYNNTNWLCIVITWPSLYELNTSLKKISEMPHAAQLKRSKQQTAQKRHRTGNFIPCPCSICLNRVHLNKRDANRHVAWFGLSDSTASTSNLIIDDSEQQTEM